MGVGGCRQVSRVSYCRGFFKLSTKILFLCFLFIVIYLQVVTEAKPASHIPEAAVISPAASPSDGWDKAHSTITPSKDEFPLPASLPLVNRRHRKYSLQQAASSPLPIRASPIHRSLTTVGVSASRLSSFVSPSIEHDQHPSTEFAVTPSLVGYSDPAYSNLSSVPFGLTQPPLSPQTECCEPNMVQRRGTQDCHCVYPVKVELFLQNVSLISNWSNEFLQELAYQLELRIDQFEIVNFYVVGAFGLNITMNIAPHTGLSFSADKVIAMNSSLALHRVRVNPDLVGDYRLLNLTWFRPLAPPPVKSRTADAVSVEGSLPHLTSTRFLSYEELKEATNNFEPASMVGEGGFGRVFKGVLSDGTAVAIKKLSSGGHQGAVIRHKIFFAMSLFQMAAWSPGFMARPILRDNNRLEELADPRLAGKYPKDDFVRVCTIAAACVAHEANQRPTMGEVVQSLKMVQHVAECQDPLPTPSTHPNNKQSSTTYESDATSSMFSSGPFSGLSLFDNDNISKAAVFSEDLHEGR
ncbi:hypothetical protein C4D60_Mb09t15070 [Musa balbisiana]|uniref:Receptor-like PK ALE2 N-terminal domain-containing protein n=1 Tax=Musa balbisiana TaxID=52838 RepID=A0A4S8IGI3_MUSBA|nr:hypothetical protein C4D60_Mb09t15070 [Musa balbisiana]